MQRLRYGDWICGLGAAALLVVLLVADDGWGSLGWLTFGLAALAVAAGLGTVFVSATRVSPSGPVLTLVVAMLVGALACLALLVEGAWLGLLAAVVLVAGALLALRDERQPGAVDRAVERRPAPPAHA